MIWRVFQKNTFKKASLPIWPGVGLLQRSLDLAQQSFHVLRHDWDSIFHIFTDPSQDAEAAYSALGSSTTDKSGARCPSNLKNNFWYSFFWACKTFLWEKKIILKITVWYQKFQYPPIWWSYQLILPKLIFHFQRHQHKYLQQ